MYSALQLFFDTCKSKELQGCLDRSTVGVLNNKDRRGHSDLCTAQIEEDYALSEIKSLQSAASWWEKSVSYPRLNISLSHIVLCENASDDVTTINNIE